MRAACIRFVLAFVVLLHTLPVLAAKIKCVNDTVLASSVKAVLAGQKPSKLKWGSGAPLFCVARSKTLTDEEKLVAARAIVELGTDLNFTSFAGNTVLHDVAVTGPSELARFLIDRGADPDAANLDGYSPLQLAMKSGSVEIKEVFAAQGHYVDSRASGGNTSLFDAANRGDLATVQLLMLSGADASASAKSALAGAALGGHEIVVRYFLDAAKLPVDIRSSDGETALMAAAAANQMTMTRLLLEEYKADPQLTSPRGFTALSLAATAGHLDMLRYLLAHGATDDASQPSALAAAALAHQLPAMELLISSGADLGPGMSAKPGVLFWAGVRGNDDALEMLVQRGAAFPNMPTDAGPLVRAVANKHYGRGLLAKDRYGEATPYLRESIVQYETLNSALLPRIQKLEKTARREKLKGDMFATFAIAFGQFAMAYQQAQNQQTLSQIKAMGYANQDGTGLAGYYNRIDMYEAAAARAAKTQALADSNEVARKTAEMSTNQGSGGTNWHRKAAIALTDAESLSNLVAQYLEESKVVSAALQCANAAAAANAAARADHCL